MNEHGYRPNWWPNENKAYSNRSMDLLQMAQDLHEHTTGSSDCLKNEEADFLICAVRH